MNKVNNFKIFYYTTLNYSHGYTLLASIALLNKMQDNVVLPAHLNIPTLEMTVGI